MYSKIQFSAPLFQLQKCLARYKMHLNFHGYSLNEQPVYHCEPVRQLAHASIRPSVLRKVVHEQPAHLGQIECRLSQVSILPRVLKNYVYAQPDQHGQMDWRLARALIRPRVQRNSVYA